MRPHDLRLDALRLELVAKTVGGDEVPLALGLDPIVELCLYGRATCVCACEA